MTVAVAHCYRAAHSQLAHRCIVSFPRIVLPFSSVQQPSAHVSVHPNYIRTILFSTYIHRTHLCRFLCSTPCVVCSCVTRSSRLTNRVRACLSPVRRRRRTSVGCSRRQSSSGSPAPATGSTRRSPRSFWRRSVRSWPPETQGTPWLCGGIADTTRARNNLGQSLPDPG